VRRIVQEMVASGEKCEDVVRETRGQGRMTCIDQPVSLAGKAVPSSRQIDDSRIKFGSYSRTR
jgi:hypothetical protein